MSHDTVSGTIHSLSINQVEEASSTCFVCKTPVSKALGNKSDEHVVSDWLIRDCGLANKRITLPNGSQYKYTGCKVTCCLSCNGAMSTQFEQKIKRIFSRGYDKLKLDHYHREALLSWMCKLRCAAATKCMSFYINPAHRNLPNGGTPITNDPKFIADLEQTRLLLKKRIDQGGELSEQDAASVGSIFVFKCKMEDDDPDKFYYSELHQTVPIAIFRYRDIGVVAFFEGGDEIERWLSGTPTKDDLQGIGRAVDWHSIKSARSMVISDEQLEEVASVISHAAYLRLGLLLPDKLPMDKASLVEATNLVETPIDTVFVRRDSFGLIESTSIAYQRGLFLAMICQNTYEEWWEAGRSLLVQMYPRDEYFLHTKELKYTHLADHEMSVIDARIGQPIDLSLRDGTIHPWWESNLSCAKQDSRLFMHRCTFYETPAKSYESPSLRVDSGSQDHCGYKYYLAPMTLGYLSRGDSERKVVQNVLPSEELLAAYQNANR